MMDRLFTREPSFCGNTGYNGNTQQPRSLQPLPINKRGGNKGNTYLYIYRDPAFVCCRFKKAATGCQKKYQLNQWCYRCCLVARVFEISQGNYRGVVSFVMRTLPDCLLAVPHPPFWQALFALLTFSQPWGLGSTSSPCTPTAQWRA